MNPIEVYTDAGTKAGTAAKRKDMSTVTHWNGWLSRAVDLEPEDRKAECRAAYRNAYREASGAGGQPQYFR